MEASVPEECIRPRRAGSLYEKLTRAELEVIELIASGLPDRVIAKRLFVSMVTVRRRATSFREKVGAHNRAEAVAIAVTCGWFAHPISRVDD